jgi:hypothetical protein
MFVYALAIFLFVVKNFQTFFRRRNSLELSAVSSVCIERRFEDHLGRHYHHHHHHHHQGSDLILDDDDDDDDDDDRDVP